MKLLSVFLFVIASHLPLFSQSEVVQDVDGDYIYIYDIGDGVKDSIVMIGTSSFKLISYKVEGNEVMFSSGHIRRINWSRYKINEKNQTCVALYSGGIDRYDYELRDKLTVVFEDINTINIFDSSEKELVKVEYKPQENIYIVDYKFKDSKKIKDIKYLPRMVQDKYSRIISRQ